MVCDVFGSSFHLDETPIQCEKRIGKSDFAFPNMLLAIVVGGSLVGSVIHLCI